MITYFFNIYELTLSNKNYIHIISASILSHTYSAKDNAQVQPGGIALSTCIECLSPSITKSISSFRVRKLIN